MAEMRATNAPVFTLTLGRVKASVFAYATESGRMRYSTKIVAFWRDPGNNNWREGSSFDTSDLPCVLKASDKCLDWILAQGN